MTTTTANPTDQSTFTITEEIFVRAPLDTTFDSLLAQLGRNDSRVSVFFRHSAHETARRFC